MYIYKYIRNRFSSHPHSELAPGSTKKSNKHVQNCVFERWIRAEGAKHASHPAAFVALWVAGREKL